ncbi:class I SAM-dependent methyltransferase [Kingella oralis]|uniref:class I SAM-dependent methyltransferase n=1 Tax=Kingella oralis TaxID=505 RepID=UPI0034E3ADBB
MSSTQIPHLDSNQQQASDALTQIIAAEIARQGAIPFSRFMELALYAPQYGYYTGGAHKIGAAGDFVTAPTLSPLFGQTLARQIAPLLPQTAGNVYEFGAGTGALAATLLNALSGCLNAYYIMELSPELAARQQAYIQQHAPDLAHKVKHLTTLPCSFDGVILGNEVLDAMPIERVCRHENGDFSRVCVGYEAGRFVLRYQSLLDPDLFQAALNYFPDPPLLPYAGDYTSELHPAQHAFIRTLAQKLMRGAMIWLDYGFDAAQYYHPERSDGTLIGHHRHHTIHDPFYRVGLTDLTAHVNFSDIAEAGCAAGLDLIGYTNQATFLYNLGILDLLAAQFPQTDTPSYFQAAQAVNTLTAQHEMGELFKVMAFGKGVAVDWRGFARGDMCHKL